MIQKICQLSQENRKKTFKGKSSGSITDSVMTHFRILNRCLFFCRMKSKEIQILTLKKVNFIIYFWGLK